MFFTAVFEILIFRLDRVLVCWVRGIIASMMGIFFNFAQGEFVRLRAYVTLVMPFMMAAGMPVWLGMIAAPFAVVCAGVVLERMICPAFYGVRADRRYARYPMRSSGIIREIVRGLIAACICRVGPDPIGGIGGRLSAECISPVWRPRDHSLIRRAGAGMKLLLCFGLRAPRSAACASGRRAVDNPSTSPSPLLFRPRNLGVHFLHSASALGGSAPGR